jgi:RNA polymerase sigma factor (TIGR02999 family)
MATQEHATELLLSLSNGNREALDELLPLVYDELRVIARRRLRYERPGHTLDTVGLVHEAYLKLFQLDRIQFNSRAHFLAIAAQAMRHILVNHALKRKRIKRGGGAPHVGHLTLAGFGAQRRIAQPRLEGGDAAAQLQRVAAEQACDQQHEGDRTPYPLAADACCGLHSARHRC